MIQSIILWHFTSEDVINRMRNKDLVFGIRELIQVIQNTLAHGDEAIILIDKELRQNLISHTLFMWNNIVKNADYFTILLQQISHTPKGRRKERHPIFKD